MNFIIDLSSSKYRDIIYNSILVVINRYTKIIRYIFITIKINAAELANIFYSNIIYRYDISYDIVSNRDSIFISAF